MPHRPLASPYVMASTIMDLIVFELSFDDEDGTVRAITMTEMLVSMRHVAGYITNHGLDHMYPLRDALPMADDAELSAYVQNSFGLPCLLPLDWRYGFLGSIPQVIAADRCPAGDVLENFVVRLGRRQQNQVAMLIAALRHELWRFEGAGGDIVSANGIPVADLYRRNSRTDVAEPHDVIFLK